MAAPAPAQPIEAPAEAERRRAFARRLAPARGLPALPAGEAAPGDEGAARSRLDRSRFAARRTAPEGGDGVGLAQAARAAAGRAEAGGIARAAALAGGAGDEGRTFLWKVFWRDIVTRPLILLNSAFSETIVVPILLTPVIFSLYLFRFVWCNLLNQGRPRRFPLLGIVGIEVMPVGGVPGNRNPQDYMEYIEGLTWITVGVLLFVLLLLFLVTMIYVAVDLCNELGPFCSIIPGLKDIV